MRIFTVRNLFCGCLPILVAVATWFYMGAYERSFPDSNAETALPSFQSPGKLIDRTSELTYEDVLQREARKREALYRNPETGVRFDVDMGMKADAVEREMERAYPRHLESLDRFGTPMLQHEDGVHLPSTIIEIDFEE